MNAQRTQIARGDKVSAPTKVVANRFSNWKGLRVLHHGRGKAYADSAFLASLGATVTDYEPNPPEGDALGVDDAQRLFGHYDVVISNYVLNVLLPPDRAQVWADFYNMARMAERRNEDVIFYVTVRSFRDRSINGQPFEDGVITSRDTFQKGYDEQELHREADLWFNNSHVVANTDTYITLALGQPI